MKKSLLFALFAAMPLMAQDCPAKADCCPKHPGCFGMMHRPHGPRPELTDEQKAEMKAKFEARHAEMKAKFMEKFDTDKDGQLSDAEKEAAKAEFGKRGPRHHGKRCGHKGPRHHGKCCGPKGPRPQLTEEQKAEMKAKFEARKAKFMEKFDTDKDGKISDAEKEAIKAAREARKAEMKAKFMEKFDTNKDGQLSDEEKAAAKAEFGKRGPRRHGKCCGPKCQK